VVQRARGEVGQRPWPRSLSRSKKPAETSPKRERMGLFCLSLFPAFPVARECWPASDMLSFSRISVWCLSFPAAPAANRLPWDRDCASPLQARLCPLLFPAYSSTVLLLKQQEDFAATHSCRMIRTDIYEWVGRVRRKGRGCFRYVKMHSCGSLYLTDVEVWL